MNILIDADSVIVDLHTLWYAEYNHRYDDDLRVEHVTSWNVHKFCKHGSKIYDILKEPEFFQRPLPIPGAIQTIKQLIADGHKIYVVTAAPLEAKTACHDKYMWFQKYLPGLITEKNLFFCKEKGMIHGDILFDDYPSNFKGFKGLAVCMDYPYNRDFNGLRVRTWDEFYRLVKSLSGTREHLNQLPTSSYGAEDKPEPIFKDHSRPTTAPFPTPYFKTSGPIYHPGTIIGEA